MEFKMDYYDILKSSSSKSYITKYPSSSDTRFNDGMLTPETSPTFRLDFKNKPRVFTIGSCFARNIEEALEPFGVILPTRAFESPPEERPYTRANALLNEYNPGSMSQKILSALNGRKAPVETIIQSGELFYDLLLPAAPGVAYERAVARRDEIDDVYTSLAEADCVIITLGFIEAWYDHATEHWLNRFPPIPSTKERHRFSLKVLDVDESMRLLSDAIDALNTTGKKVLLTVSPVPMVRTFTNRDCVIANDFSKSVLRVCADRLCANFSNVDYFPSYEMIKSLGSRAFKSDNVHVKEKFVEKVTGHMLKTYQSET
jgi:hypothetical protein